ncbi:MAG: GtrA family protein [Pirellulaceae bacterium]
MNFLLCRTFVFPSTDQPWMKQLASFFASSVMFRTAEYLAFLTLHQWYGVHYLRAVAIVLIFGFVSKFLFYNRFVFIQRVVRNDPRASNEANHLFSDDATLKTSPKTASRTP